MTKEWINKTIKDHHEMMIEKGFYDCPECEGEGEIMTMVCYGDSPIEKTEICPVCDGECLNPDKNIGELLMLIVSELGEALEAHRCGRFAVGINRVFEYDTNSLDFTKFFVRNIKDTFEDEISDVFLRLFDLCGYLGIEYKSPDRKIKGLKKELENRGEVFLLACGVISEMGLDGSMKTDIGFTIDFLMFFSEKWEIPIKKHIEAKMKYNKTRSIRHGKRY